MDQMYEGNFRGNRFWLELAVEGSSDRESTVSSLQQVSER